MVRGLGRVICLTVSLGAEIPCSLWVRKNCSMAWPASRRTSGRACVFFSFSVLACWLFERTDLADKLTVGVIV